jgi:Fe-S-cluster containining protein
MKIDPHLFSAKFPDQCRLDLCRSRCCRFGVWVDIEEQKTILASQELFVPYLRPEAKDQETWFGRTEADPDCPSGLAVETQEIAGACSFYHPDHGCVLQKGAAEAGLHEWAIKPRFCIMFPLVFSGGELTVDEDMKSLWCMKERNRTRPILDAMRKEVEFLFDEEEVRRLNAEEEPLPAVKAKGAR